MRLSKDTLVVLFCECRDNAAADALSQMLLNEFMGYYPSHCVGKPEYFRVFGNKDFQGKVYFRESLDFPA